MNKDIFAGFAYDFEHLHKKLKIIRIRADDIAKGVFIPVSSLPQKEPMKAVV